MNNLVIVGDQAYTAEEWERLERKRAYQREYSRRPEVRARKLEAYRRWRQRHLEHARAYHRDWMRRYRAEQAA